MIFKLALQMQTTSLILQIAFILFRLDDYIYTLTLKYANKKFTKTQGNCACI